jgi:hypothetical protein
MRDAERELEIAHWRLVSDTARPRFADFPRKLGL